MFQKFGNFSITELLRKQEIKIWLCLDILRSLEYHKILKFLFQIFLSSYQFRFRNLDMRSFRKVVQKWISIKFFKSQGLNGAELRSVAEDKGDDSVEATEIKFIHSK